MLRLNAFALCASVALLAIAWMLPSFIPAQWIPVVLAPLMVPFLILVLAFWGVGPFAKRLNKAAVEDAEEERQQ